MAMARVNVVDLPKEKGKTEEMQQRLKCAEAQENHSVAFSQSVSASLQEDRSIDAKERETEQLVFRKRSATA